MTVTESTRTIQDAAQNAGQTETLAADWTLREPHERQYGGHSGREIVIDTHGLTKRYGIRIAGVDHLTLRVRRGKVYGFLGPNGAGTTMTPRMLLGQTRPTARTAVVLGRSRDSPGSGR